MLDWPVDTRQTTSWCRVEAQQPNEGYMFTPNSNDGNNGDDGVRFGAQVEFSEDDTGPVITGLLVPAGEVPKNADGMHKIMVIETGKGEGAGITLIERSGKRHGPFFQGSPPDVATHELVNASWAGITEDALDYVRIAALKAMAPAMMAHQVGDSKAQRSRMFDMLARMGLNSGHVLGVHDDGEICPEHLAALREALGVDDNKMFEGFRESSEAETMIIADTEDHEHVLVAADNFHDVFVPDGTGKCVRMAMSRVLYVAESAPTYSEGAPNPQAEMAGVIGCWLYPVGVIGIPEDDGMTCLMVIQNFSVYATENTVRKPGFASIVPVETWGVMAPEGAVKGRSGKKAELAEVASLHNESLAETFG